MRKLLGALLGAAFIMSGASIAAAADLAIQGVVWVKGERKGIAGATIYAVNRPDLSPAVTDDKGRFTFTAPEAGDYRLVAVKAGFEKPAPLLATVGDKGVTFYLAPVDSLTEVVVDADRVASRVGKRVITGDEVNDMPGIANDPMHYVDALPGASGGYDGGEPAVRGSSYDSNAYYIDFIPVNDVFHVGGWRSIVNADLMDDFNIFFSSAGPEYTSALGGVFDIRLKDPRTDRWGGKLETSMAFTDMYVEGPVTDNSSFFFAAHRSYIDVIIKALEQEDIVAGDGQKIVTFPWFWDMTGKYVWNVNDRNKLTLLSIQTGEEMAMEFTGESDDVKHDPALEGLMDRTYNRSISGATLETDLSANAANTFSLNSRTYSWDEKVSQVGTAKTTLVYNGVREQVKWRLADSHTITVGADVEQIEADLEMEGQIDWPSEFDPDHDFSSAERKKLSTTFSALQFDGYLSDRWDVTSDLTVMAGARSYYNEYLDESGVLPTASVEFSISDALLLTAGWGQYAQFPTERTVIENFGNPELNFEKSQNISVGAQLALAHGWSVKTEGFQKTFSDLVVPVADERNYVNGGSGEAWGVELLVEKKRTAHLSGWFSLSYSNTERTNDLTGESFVASFDRPVDLNLLVKYADFYGWDLSAKWTYMSGSPFTPVVGTYRDEDGRVRPIYGEIGSERLPDFHQLDIRIERPIRFDTWMMNVFLEVGNVYGAENVVGYHYNGDYSEKIEQAGVPTLPFIGVEAKF